MNSFLRVIKILLTLALFCIAVAGLFKAEFTLSAALMIGSFFIGIMGSQIQFNPGYAMSYSGSDKWMSGAFALIQAIIGIIFLTGSIGGFMEKDYANASIVLIMGFILFSPLSSLVFYHGGYLVKDQASNGRKEGGRGSYNSLFFIDG